MITRLENRLADPAPLILDGGLATELEALGYDIGTDLWSAELLQSKPQAIIDAHMAFLVAGAECIISASYQASRQGFAELGLNEVDADKLIASSVSLAQSARDQFLQDEQQKGRDVFVAASIGPYGAVLHDGSEYTGDYDVSRTDLVEFHRPRVQLLDDSGADILACETVPNKMEADVLCELLQDTKTPAWVSFACRDDQRISDGTAVAEVVRLFATHQNVFGVGINCTAPQYAKSLISRVRAAAPGKQVVVYPNSGETYRSSDNSWHGTVTPLECGHAAKAWHDAGASIIGGCCRMMPEHIAAMRRELH